MLTVGDTFPQFSLKSVGPDTTPANFPVLTNQAHAGKWAVFVFWPKDFTFVCPTEILAFGEINEEFRAHDALLFGVSVDSEFVHLSWRKSRQDLAQVPYPWLSDLKRELSLALGVLHKDEGVPLRATFIVDPQGVIRFASVNDLNVGRNPQEVLRVLEALQTGELTACNWRPGDKPIQVG